MTCDRTAIVSYKTRMDWQDRCDGLARKDRSEYRNRRARYGWNIESFIHDNEIQKSKDGSGQAHLFSIVDACGDLFVLEQGLRQQRMSKENVAKALMVELGEKQ